MHTTIQLLTTLSLTILFLAMAAGELRLAALCPLTAVRLKEPTRVRFTGLGNCWERANKEGARHTAKFLASICESVHCSN